LQLRSQAATKAVAIFRSAANVATSARKSRARHLRSARRRRPVGDRGRHRCSPLQPAMLLTSE
jgi:hypothetical protein